MKALQLHGHRDIRLDDLPVPKARPGWAVVKVAWSSICHSDLREWEGPSYIGRTGQPNPITGVFMPVVLGHEFSGTVAEMNGSHPSIQVGDLVAPDGCIYDETCWYCRHGRYNLCDNGGVLGFDGHGSHAEYVEVPIYSLNKLPDDFDDERGALIEPLAVAVHGVRQGKTQVGDIVAIVGAGMIGLCAAMVARAAGAADVFVSELLEGRRERARQFGFRVLDPDDGDLVDQIRDQTGGRGAGGDSRPVPGSQPRRRLVRRLRRLRLLAPRSALGALRRRIRPDELGGSRRLRLGPRLTRHKRT